MNKRKHYQKGGDSYEAYTLDITGAPVRMEHQNLYNCSFFRKPLQDSDCSLTEKRIAKKIFDSREKNKTIVPVLGITKKYIDYKLLDMDKTEDNQVASDINNSLRYLHSLGIVYIDLKPDNIGYDHTDKTWKLIDFDYSGITKNGTIWTKEPCSGYNLKNAKLFCTGLIPTNRLKILCSSKSLYNIDKILFEALFKTTFIE